MMLKLIVLATAVVGFAFTVDENLDTFGEVRAGIAVLVTFCLLGVRRNAPIDTVEAEAQDDTM